MWQMPKGGGAPALATRNHLTSRFAFKVNLPEPSDLLYNEYIVYNTAQVRMR